MPTPTLIATPGSASANTFATLAEANTYHDERPQATVWTGASEAVRKVALVFSARALCSLIEWEGWRTSTTQALEFPRVGLLAANKLESLPDNVVPIELKWAHSEFARLLIATDRVADNQVESQGLRSLSAGPVAMTFKDVIVPKVIPDFVYFMLPSWWGHVRTRGGSFCVPLVRG